MINISTSGAGGERSGGQTRQPASEGGRDRRSPPRAGARVLALASTLDQRPNVGTLYRQQSAVRVTIDRARESRATQLKPALFRALILQLYVTYHAVLFFSY